MEDICLNATDSFKNSISENISLWKLDGNVSQLFKVYPVVIYINMFQWLQNFSDVYDKYKQAFKSNELLYF